MRHSDDDRRLLGLVTLAASDIDADGGTVPDYVEAACHADYRMRPGDRERLEAWIDALPGYYGIRRNPVGEGGTAITRGGPSAPVRWLHERGLIKGPVLDFGSGVGEDADWLRARGVQVREYDPNFEGVSAKPEGTYNTVLATYVLNVVPKAQEAGLLRQIRGYLRPGGHAYITVRSDVSRAGETARGYQRPVTLQAEAIGSPGSARIYQIMKGARANPKEVRGRRYVHRSALGDLTAAEQAQVRRARARLPSGWRFDVVRVDPDGGVMFGATTSWDRSNPELLESWLVRPGQDPLHRQYTAGVRPRYHRTALMTRQNPRASRRSRNVYTDRHWGIEPTVVHRVRMNGLPREVVEMGKLLRLDVIDPEDGAELGIDFPRRQDIMLAFDHGKPERLYCVYPSDVAQWVAEKLWQPGEPTYWLGDVARDQGGIQADRRYPRVKVQVLGECVHVLYRTRKLQDYQEDGQGSDYIHELGEDSGLRPLLTVTEDGRLWFAGGNFSVPTGGITD